MINIKQILQKKHKKMGKITEDSTTEKERKKKRKRVKVKY